MFTYHKTMHVIYIPDIIKCLFIMYIIVQSNIKYQWITVSYIITEDNRESSYTVDVEGITDYLL